MAVQLNNGNNVTANLDGVNLPSLSGLNVTNTPPTSVCNTTKEVSFVQINLQKSKIASSIVSSKTIEWSSKPLFIALQEPWLLKGGTIGNRPRDVQIYAAPNSRAALMVTKDLHTWAMSDFTSQDQAVCMWNTGNNEFPKIIVSSVYCDIKKPMISQELSKLIDFCNVNSYPVILCMDSNAHSSVWHCSENNARGDDLEEFLLQGCLSVANLGSHPTFQTVRASSIIDVTCTSDSISDRIKDWHVMHETLGSDHYGISFKLSITQFVPKQVHDWKSTDWSALGSILARRSHSWHPSLTLSQHVLDAEVDSINADIIDALDKTTRSVTIKKRVRKNGWWNEDLNLLRKRMQDAHKKMGIK